MLGTEFGSLLKIINNVFIVSVEFGVTVFLSFINFLFNFWILQYTPKIFIAINIKTGKSFRNIHFPNTKINNRK